MLLHTCLLCRLLRSLIRRKEEEEENTETNDDENPTEKRTASNSFLIIFHTEIHQIEAGWRGNSVNRVGQNPGGDAFTGGRKAHFFFISLVEMRQIEAGG